MNLIVKFITFIFLFFIFVPSVSASSIFLDENPSFFILAICLIAGFLFSYFKDKISKMFASGCFIAGGFINWGIDYGLDSPMLTELVSMMFLIYAGYLIFNYGVNDEE